MSRDLARPITLVGAFYALLKGVDRPGGSPRDGGVLLRLGQDGDVLEIVYCDPEDQSGISVKMPRQAVRVGGDVAALKKVRELRDEVRLAERADA